MAYTYNISTDRGRVRLLVGDTTTKTIQVQGEHYAFSDAEIDAFLDLNSDDVWAAAADACRTFAANEILGALRLSLSGFTIDRSKVPEFWNNLADKYEAKAKAGDITEFIDSFDHQISDFGEDETEYVGDIV